MKCESAFRKNLKHFHILSKLNQIEAILKLVVSWETQKLGRPIYGIGLQDLFEELSFKIHIVQIPPVKCPFPPKLSIHTSKR